MANIFSGKIDTEGEYKDLAELTGAQIVADQVYLIQVIGAATFCASASQPTDGGFTLFNDQVARFKLESGEKMWIKLYDNKKHLLNLAV